MLTMTFDKSVFDSKLREYPQMIRSATASALRNAIAFSGLREELDASLRKAVDRPTPFTAQGGGEFYVDVPRSGKEELYAKIGVKRKQAAYLQFIVKGVPRDSKIIERRAPDGKMLLPTRQITLDAFGNVPRKQFLDIVRKAHTKGTEYFYLPRMRGKMYPGIYRKDSKTARPVPYFFAVDSVDYQRQWDFFKIAEAAIQKRVPAAIEDALKFQLKKLA